MKKVLLSACLCFLSLGVFAQDYKTPPQDTLVVTKVLYQMEDVPEQDWPLKEIYRNQFGFVLFDQQLDIVERKEYASAVYYKLKLYNTSEYYDLWSYELPDNILRLKIGGYQFYCYDAHRLIPFRLVEQKPQFNGGDANSFAMWVNENLVYPKEAYEDGTQGKVTVQFTIDKTGEVRDVCVLRGVHPALDKEAVRVISSSPKWTPAIYDGKPASVTYNFPVVFQLE